MSNIAKGDTLRGQITNAMNSSLLPQLVLGKAASARNSETSFQVCLPRCATKASKHRGAARDPARVERIKHRQR